jgi:phosphoribosylglycinamide formyltransferase-1
MLNLAILISNAGTGTNLQAIIDAIENKKLKAKIAVVISGDKDAYGIERAKKHAIPYVIVGKEDNIEHILKTDYNVDIIALAGWKRIIPPSFIDAFKNKILNLHPGLIPDTMNGIVHNPDGTNALWNKGMMTEKAIQNFISKRATYAGSTIHFLSHEFDFGPVVKHCFEKIKKTDSVKSLYARLKEKENHIYVDSLIQLSQSRL